MAAQPFYMTPHFLAADENLTTSAVVQASAGTGPTPGMVISRRQSASRRTTESNWRFKVMKFLAELRPFLQNAYRSLQGDVQSSLVMMRFSSDVCGSKNKPQLS
jgi:hypothetical protein